MENSKVSDNAYGGFIYISYRIPVDVLERFLNHKDPRIVSKAEEALRIRKGRGES